MFFKSIVSVYLTVLSLFVSNSFAEMNMDLSPYPGATRNDKLNSAFFCMSSVKNKALSGIMANDLELAGNCLRYGFHDCGTFDKSKPNSKGGCNGGIRTTIANAISKGVYDTPANPNPQDGGMRGCQTLLVGTNGKNGICNQVRLEHPSECGKMPFADCINFAGYLAVVATGGAPPGGCPWVPGRVDIDQIQQTELLPSEQSNADALHGNFDKYNLQYSKFGFSTLNEVVVVLSGAHTIGKSRVHDKNACSKGLGNLSGTPKKFDTEYYKGIVTNINHSDNKGGWFCSDIHGLCNNINVNGGGNNPDLTHGFCSSSDSPFSGLYIKYAFGSEESFHTNFCKAYQAMSLIGYNMPASYIQDAVKFANLLI